MRYLKITSIISFLFINGLGENGIPNFAGIPLCLLSFFNDLLTNTVFKISWALGAIGILSIVSLIIIAISRQYRDRFLLLSSFIVLLGTEIYFSGVLRYNKITPWFIGPSIIFILSTTLLLLKSFRIENEKKVNTH